jgi:hypothetical protein
MAQQIIGIGTTANDGTGEPLRAAFNKINLNFSEIYARDPVGANISFSGNMISSVNSNGNIELEPNGAGRVVVHADNITIAVSKTPVHSTGTLGDKRGMIAWDTGFFYVCTADYDGSTNIWKRTALSDTW